MMALRPSPERSENMYHKGRSFLLVLSPCLRCLQSVVFVIGLSACGPTSSDPASSVESRTSPSGVSTLPPVQEESALSRNDPTKTASIVVPRTSASDQKMDPSSSPDRALLSERTQPSQDVSEHPGALPMMNVWTQEGIPVSVVVLEDQTDDTSLEEDANNERHNWELTHEAERPEDEKEEGEVPSEQKER